MVFCSPAMPSMVRTNSPVDGASFQSFSSSLPSSLMAPFLMCLATTFFFSAFSTVEVGSLTARMRFSLSCGPFETLSRSGPFHMPT